MTSIARVSLCTFFLAASVTAAACSGTSTGTVTGGGGADGGSRPNESLTAEAQASPYLAKCRVSCTPPDDGPCADEDPIPCIEKCTALTEGLKVACAQCIVEGSGWTGRACSPTCPTCPACAFGPRGAKCATAASSCDEGADCPPPPMCTSDDESCSGVSFAKTSGECAAACAD